MTYGAGAIGAMRPTADMADITSAKKKKKVSKKKIKSDEKNN